MKGVSQLVAATLLITFTIGLGVVILSWSQEYTKKSMTPASEEMEYIIDCSIGDIVIEEVIVNRYDNTTKVIVRNTGTTLLNITEVYAFSTDKKCKLSTKHILLNKTNKYEFEAPCDIFNERCNNFEKAIVLTTCPDVTMTVETKPTCYE